MFSSQIAQALNSDPNVSKYFSGVFARDKLPKIDQYPNALVANTDPSDKKGEHWVAFHFDHSGKGEYFDSYGKWLKKADFVNFIVDSSPISQVHNRQVQGIGTTVCGQYCIDFLSRKGQGESFQSIVNSYTGTMPGQFDARIGDYVNRKYNIHIIQSGGGGSVYGCSEYPYDQCCCSMRECEDYKYCETVRSWKKL
jgi:hypothetical protein